MVEELVRRHAGDGTVFFLAHDMGTSVANELMARDLEGALEMDLSGALLLNGSMVQGAASPTLGQRILRSPLGPLFSRLSTERFFRQQFGSIFSPGHPLTDEEAEDQWALICAGGRPDPQPQDDRLHGGALQARRPLARRAARLGEAAVARLGDARPGRHRGGPGRRARAAPEAR